MKALSNYLNEKNINEHADEWTWEEECDKEGKIRAEIGMFGAGGREYDKAYFELVKNDEDDDYYYVTATCVNSEIRKINKGYEIDFDLPKDIAVWDVDDELQRAIEDEEHGWNSRC